MKGVQKKSGSEAKSVICVLLSARGVLCQVRWELGSPKVDLKATREIGYSIKIRLMDFSELKKMQNTELSICKRDVPPRTMCAYCTKVWSKSVEKLGPLEPQRSSWLPD